MWGLKISKLICIIIVQQNTATQFFISPPLNRNNYANKPCGQIKSMCDFWEYRDNELFYLFIFFENLSMTSFSILRTQNSKVNHRSTVTAIQINNTGNKKCVIFLIFFQIPSRQIFLQ